MSDFADNLIDNFSTASRNVQKARSTSNLELFSEAWNSLSGYIEELESRIAELEEAQRWRVVADGELPEVYRDEDGKFIPFLVCEGDGGNPFIAMYNGINWWAGIFVADVTHWMPLPSLPEVQE